METVLIVDDDRVLQHFLSKRLERYAAKFETLHAYDGEEAIEILSQRSVSLLVTDIMMPEVDGLTLLSHMHNNYPDITCIVITGNRSQARKIKMQKDSIFRLFIKPFHYEALAQAILQALDQEVPEGVFKGISVASFLQMIEIEEKTCLLEVRSPGKAKGVFYFQEGILFDAAFGKQKGEKAVIDILLLKNTAIVFKAVPKGRVKQKIEETLTGLIMEAMRRRDEGSGRDAD